MDKNDHFENLKEVYNHLFNKDKFLKTKERLFGKIGVYEMSKIHSFEIDDKIDTKIVNSLKKFF